MMIPENASLDDTQIDEDDDDDGRRTTVVITNPDDDRPRAGIVRASHRRLDWFRRDATSDNRTHSRYFVC